MENCIASVVWYVCSSAYSTSLSPRKMKCPKCDKSLITLKRSSEPEGIRMDLYCSPCNVWFMSTKSHLVEMTFNEPIEELSMREEIRMLKAENAKLKTLLDL